MYLFFSLLLSSSLDPLGLDKGNPHPYDWRQTEGVQRSTFNRKWEVRGGEARCVKTSFSNRRAQITCKGSQNLA